MDKDKGTAMPGNVVRIDEERIKDHLGRIVRGTVEDTLNALLDAEADRLCNAKRYERIQGRRDMVPVSISASCTRGLAKSRCGCRSCAGRPSRRRSLSAIGGARPPWRRP